MFGKRGVMSFVTLLELGMAILVGGMFLYAASSIGDQDRVEEFARAKDIALLIDALQATAYDVNYVYPESILNSKVSAQDGVVSIVPNNILVPRPQAFTTSQFTYTVLTSAISFVDATVSSSFFTITKQDKTITLVDDGSTFTPSELTQRLPRGDVILDFRRDETTSQESFLSRVQGSVSGSLQQSFETQGTANRYLGFSYGDRAIIYHSDSVEMKELAEALAARLSTSGQEFIVGVGTPLFTGEQAIQIQFNREAVSNTQQRLPIFTLEVTQTYEAFYE